MRCASGLGVAIVLFSAMLSFPAGVPIHCLRRMGRNPGFRRRGRAGSHHSWSAAVEPWARGKHPRPAPDCGHAFAQGLKHPRWMHVLPNGDVLVAESPSEPGPLVAARLFQN